MHDKVKQAYKENKFDIPANPQDTNHEIFVRKTRRARPEDIKTFINQVWRVSQGPKKDFIFYEKKTVIPDLAGNEETDTELVGRYEMPRFRNIYNNQTGEPEATALRGFETEYDIPFSKENMEEILNSGDSSNTVFTLSLGGRKYGGFDANDFTNRSFDELTQLALYGSIQDTVQNIKPQDIRAAEDAAELKGKREQAETDAEIHAYQDAVDRVKKLKEAQKLQDEQLQKEAEEEAQKRQESVAQQSEKRTVKAEVTANFDKETPMSLQEQKEASGEVPNPAKRKAGARPEKEQVEEEVSFVLGKPEDQNVNEDEEIAKQFKEQEKAKKSNK